MGQSVAVFIAVWPSAAAAVGVSAIAADLGGCAGVNLGRAIVAVVL